MQSSKDKIQSIVQLALNFLALILIPFSFLGKLICNKVNFDQKLFLNKFGNLIEGMKKRKSLIVYVYPFLLLNRIIYAFIPFFCFNSPSLQILFLILKSHFYIIFLAETKINIYWLEYYQDIFNEFAL